MNQHVQPVTFGGKIACLNLSDPKLSFMAVHDYFSNVADQYAQYRPTYPDELYQQILKEVPGKELVWDVATGNGQAAAALARNFKQVIATDPSRNQIAKAISASNIEYRIEPAEMPSLDNGVADLITVAVGAHWLDLPEFEKAVARVAKPGGVLAIWAYFLPQVKDLPDEIIQHFYNESLRGYWPKERRHIDEKYRNITFSFPEIAEEDIPMTAEWTLDQLCGFFSSWSAVNRKIKDTGEDPVLELRKRAEQYWPVSDEPRPIEWPLFLSMWRVEN